MGNNDVDRDGRMGDVQEVCMIGGVVVTEVVPAVSPTMSQP